MNAVSVYDDMRNSGVDWVGSIPTSWSVVPLKSLGIGRDALFIDGDWIESKDLSDEGIRYITTGNVGEGHYKEQGSGFITEDTFNRLQCTEVQPGDILVSRLNLPIARACIVPDLGARIVTSVDNVIVRPRPGFDARYIVFMLSGASHFFNTENLARGTTMSRISRSALGNIRYPFPSHEEQRAIASNLDRETARIDALIEKKTRFIKLLKEKRQALITQAVTKGLDPKMPMKDSGVEWIGKVPTHWRVLKLKQLGKLKGGSGFPPALQGETDNEIGFYKVGDLGKSADGVHLAEANHSITQDQAKKLGARIFDVGTICWAKIGAALSLNRRRVLVSRACLDNNMTGFIVDQRIGNPSYCLALMSIVDFSIHARPGAVPSFSEGDQGELQVPCPPLGEQAAIFANIQARTMRLDKLLAKTSASIDLLRERRSALITAAVTGQIDLRKNTA